MNNCGVEAGCKKLLDVVADLTTIVVKSATRSRTMAKPDGVLKQLFSSALRVRVLSWLFLRPGESFHVRGLASTIKESPGTLARELANLENAGIVISRRVGNQKHYSLNMDSPIHGDLRNVFLKTTGAGQEIRADLESVPGVEIAFIYGSFAAGDATAQSDIDLMIVGEVSDRKIALIVSRIERHLRREINYTLFSRSEVEKRLGRQGDFVHEVFTGPRVLLIGRVDDRLFQTR